MKENVNIKAADSNIDYPGIKTVKNEAFKIYDKEKKKMNKFDVEQAQEIFSKVVCQDDNIEKLIELLNLWFIKKQKDKPLSVMFAGISGSGKTYTAERVAELFNKLGYEYHYEDMNQYKTEHDVSRLIGSAEGLVGSDSPPLIVQKLTKANGKMVICFDEIDKAYHGMMNTLMQIMDKGLLKTNKEEIDMRECILIFTSNGAMNELTKFKAGYTGDVADDNFQTGISKILSEAGIAPWILGRLDLKFIFNPLDKKAVIDIAAFEIIKLLKSMNNDINLKYVDPEIFLEIANTASGSNEGARKVKSSVSGKLNKVLLRFLNENDDVENVDIILNNNGIEIVAHNDSLPGFEVSKQKAKALASKI